MKNRFIIIFVTVLQALHIKAQEIGLVSIDHTNGFEISAVTSKQDVEYGLIEKKPFVSLDIDNEKFNSTGQPGSSGVLSINGKVDLTLKESEGLSPMYILTIKNISGDTVQISNIVPLGEERDHVYITGRGDEWLSKTKLYIPGRSAVSVIVPDNAWELGYSSLALEDNLGVYALGRRSKIENGTRRRFWTDLNPGGEVEYTIYFDLFTGNWQEGLRKCFQEKYLYDLTEFDNTLFEREDLAWIREAYVIHLIMAWDHHFYDNEKGKYMLDEFVSRGKEWYGGDDVIGIWPTWPTLGLDERNQWDLYHDLPGGIQALRKVSTDLKRTGTRLFISYNPWDQSTRDEDHLAGMASLIKEIDADGVVLDTRGNSSREFQEATDIVKDGVIMFSEGMAITKDMPGIIAGRVHNALYYPPILNLNKLIKPDFAIFRVAEVTYERIRREYALAFFNGYGTEINIFKPGQPNWIEDDYRFLGKTTRILRENHPNFIVNDWTPLIPATEDSIYVNKWPSEYKTLYTIFSLHPEGFAGGLFRVDIHENKHYVDLWNHEEVELDTVNNEYLAKVSIGSFDKQLLGTNNEGAVGCIAELPKYLQVEMIHGMLSISSLHPGEIRIWKGIPDYEKEAYVLQENDYLYDPGRFEGKIVVQLFDEKDLLDERVVNLFPGAPKLISKSVPTKAYGKPLKGMVAIPAGKFKPEFIDGDSFIYYPAYEGPEEIGINAFFMDEIPVTNAMFEEFLKKSGYVPKDTANFLKHWKDGKIPIGMEEYPVVYVSLDDARAYADWAGKRLPTENEWQYAAQTDQWLKWPWGNEFDSLKCNPGNGKIDPVRKYPEGINPNGLYDLVGNVWQLTNDTYESGSYTFTILKGGSFFKPTSSWWYVQGGPQELRHRQILLHVSDGFDRNSTVGFRCVADVER